MKAYIFHEIYHKLLIVLIFDTNVTVIGEFLKRHPDMNL